MTGSAFLFLGLCVLTLLYKLIRPCISGRFQDNLIVKLETISKNNIETYKPPSNQQDTYLLFNIQKPGKMSRTGHTLIIKGTIDNTNHQTLWTVFDCNNKKISSESFNTLTKAIEKTNKFYGTEVGSLVRIDLSDKKKILAQNKNQNFMNSFYNLFDTHDTLWNFWFSCFIIHCFLLSGIGACMGSFFGLFNNTTDHIGIFSLASLNQVQRGAVIGGSIVFLTTISAGLLILKIYQIYQSFSKQKSIKSNLNDYVDITNTKTNSLKNTLKS
jgi:hypothetical protein